MKKSSIIVVIAAFCAALALTIGGVIPKAEQSSAAGPNYVQTLSPQSWTCQQVVLLGTVTQNIPADLNVSVNGVSASLDVSGLSFQATAPGGSVLNISVTGTGLITDQVTFDVGGPGECSTPSTTTQPPTTTAPPTTQPPTTTAPPTTQPPTTTAPPTTQGKPSGSVSGSSVGSSGNGSAGGASASPARAVSAQPTYTG